MPRWYLSLLHNQHLQAGSDKCVKVTLLRRKISIKKERCLL